MGDGVPGDGDASAARAGAGRGPPPEDSRVGLAAGAPDAGDAAVAAAASGDGTRGAAGRARRCTAGVCGDLVREVGRVGACLTGVTPTPAGRNTAGPSEPPAPWSPYDTTGRVSDGSSSPEPGRADALSIPLTSPPGAPSSTACDRFPRKEGFCHVLRRPPNPASATGPAAPAVTR
ncbi:hypothetical protein [Streptomyces sp. NBC_01006]|uniref:hypothetical protein n=1 Tax=Streptomyces sp. NBC_01006 TaxID=2903716 RepID=UPI0038644685|nr:hypothetical protein OG509_27825 [Streptomyces sp. NBC_01006]